MADVKIRPRRGTTSEWRTMNPILAEGEIGVEYPDTGILSGDIRIKFGDGISKWNDLPYAINANEASSIIGGGITSSHLISVKHATTEEWVIADPILEAGEIVYDDRFTIIGFFNVHNNGAAYTATLVITCKYII